MAEPVNSSLGRVVSIMLFGSRARGDATDASDTDVLLVTERGFPQFRSLARFSLSFYPRDQLLAMAAAGDLFAGHLACEAVPVHDPEGFLPELRRRFVPMSRPEDAVSRATDLGDFLVRFGGRFADPSLANKRISWVVRTILIARALRPSRFDRTWTSRICGGWVISWIAGA